MQSERDFSSVGRTVTDMIVCMMRRPSKLLNFSDVGACGIDYDVDYYSAAKTLVFIPYSNITH